jgi:cytochrome c peroxidase
VTGVQTCALPIYVSTIDAKLNAYSLLMSKGLIRIGLPIPVGAEFSVSVTDDPFGCNTDSRTGLATGIVSIYRRPLPSTNLGFLGVGFPTSSDPRMNPTIMWDGREPSLVSQAKDATLGHAQASTSPTTAQVNQIVGFETGLFTAQAYDNHAKMLNEANGASGGPGPLLQQLSQFYPGVNDPIGLNPSHTLFTSAIFNIYASWEGLFNNPRLTPARASVARGEALFNNTQFNITNVGGLNDALGMAVIPGFCGTCHDSPNVGNHSVKMPLNIGVANAGLNSPPGLDISGLPVFTLTCTTGPLINQTFTVTDLGRALISGKCADIGKVKGPILRGLAARAPYFHNGSAATLLEVVNFYDVRFSLGFTDQQKQDLVAFLKTL